MFPELELHATSSRCLVEYAEDAESSQEDPDDYEHRSQKHLTAVHIDGPGDEANHADGNADRHGGRCKDHRPLMAKRPAVRLSHPSEAGVDDGVPVFFAPRSGGSSPGSLGR